MAENDQDKDEYEFPGMDEINLEEENPFETGQKPPKAPPELDSEPGMDNRVKTRAIVVVSALIALLVIYKFAGVFFGKKPEEQAALPSLTANTSEEIKPVTPVINNPPIEPQQPVVSNTDKDAQQKLEQQVNTLEVVQGNVNNQLGSLSTQLAGMTGNLNDLTNQITQLQHTISQLNSQLQEQAQDLARLKFQTRKPITKRVVRSRVPGITYSVQAVIPGRAWLIASNGATITVSEGSKIAGYGVVKLIDPNQGRVLMSSGKVIRFSQADY